MSISRYKNTLFMAALMTTTFLVNVACVRAAGPVNETASNGFTNSASGQPKPIAGRNRRRSDIRQPSLDYPQANTDRLNVAVGTSKLYINVLSNDRGKYLKLSTVNSRSAKGGRVYMKNNKVLYLPPTNYRGQDSFWYTVVDRGGRRHSAKVIVCFCGN
jgi:hypothetical protein